MTLWQHAPQEQRRAAVISNVLALAIIVILAWIFAAFYIPFLMGVHEHLGSFFFTLFGTGGNTAAVILMILLAALTGVLTSLWLRGMASRLERFLAGPVQAN